MTEFTHHFGEEPEPGYAEPANALLASFTEQARQAWDAHRHDKASFTTDVVELYGRLQVIEDGISTGIILRGRTAAVLAVVIADLQHRADRDSVTDLYSRTGILRRTREELAEAERQGSTLSFAYIDLDGFKGVNDTLGHSAGDKLLEIYGRRLTEALRESDPAGRLGGDEFAVVMPQTDRKTAGVVFRRIVKNLPSAVRAEFDSTQKMPLPAPVTMSVGISDTTVVGYDIGSLVSSADTAMYNAKGRGKNRVAGAQVARRRTTQPPRGRIN